MKALPLAALALLGGCASHAKLQTERTYQVQWLGERPRLEETQVSVTLARDGRAYGSTGCNHWFANYHLDHHHLSFEHPGSTRRFCSPLLQEQEQRFLDLLSGIQRWKHGEGEEIKLLSPGTEALILAPMNE